MSPVSPMVQGLLLSLASGICYGSIGILARFGYEAGLSLTDVLISRFVFGSSFLGLYLLLTRRHLFRIRFRNLVQVAGVGLFVFCTQSIMFFSAIQTIPVSTAVLILYMYPVTVTLLSAVFFRMKITPLVILSLTLVSAGFCLVFLDAFRRQVDPTGLAYALAAPVLFSLYMILCQKIMQRENPLTVTFYMLVFTGLGFVMLGNPGIILELSGSRLAISIGLGLVPTALSISLLYLAIKRIGSALASIFSSIEPVAAIVLAAVFLGEEVALYQIVGTALILAGIVAPNIRRKGELGMARSPRIPGRPADADAEQPPSS